MRRAARERATAARGAHSAHGDEEVGPGEAARPSHVALLHRRAWRARPREFVRRDRRVHRPFKLRRGGPHSAPAEQCAACGALLWRKVGRQKAASHQEVRLRAVEGAPAAEPRGEGGRLEVRHASSQGMGAAGSALFDVLTHLIVHTSACATCCTYRTDGTCHSGRSRMRNSPCWVESRTTCVALSTSTAGVGGGMSFGNVPAAQGTPSP